MSAADGAWDPAGLASGPADDRQEEERRQAVAHGSVAFLESLERFAVPELFGKYEWVGATGSGADGQRHQLYRVRKKNAKGEWEKVEPQKAIEPAPSKGELQKKTQAQFDRKEFSWRKIMHVLQSGLSGTSDGGFVTEVVFSPTPLRMYTDHRVMGAIVLPGVSHVALMAATGLVGYQDGSMPGRNQEQCAVVKEVLFERPYVVSAGTEILAAVGDSGYQPNPSGPVLGTEVPGSSMTYCRSMSVAREIKTNSAEW